MGKRKMKHSNNGRMLTAIVAILAPQQQFHRIVNISNAKYLIYIQYMYRVESRSIVFRSFRITHWIETEYLFVIVVCWATGRA